MKTKLLLLVIALGVVACTNEPVLTKAPPPEINQYGTKLHYPIYDVQSAFHTDATVVIIDSCEYLAWGDALTHKGNCKNPVHPENYPVVMGKAKPVE